MQMVAAVILWEHARRVAWIAQNLIKVDHRIKCAAASDPGIDGLALGLALRRVVTRQKIRSFIWQQGASEYLEPSSMCAQDKLFVTSDHALGSYSFRWITTRNRRTCNVVDA